LTLKGIEILNSLLFLKKLDCSNNQLTSLEGIENLVNLNYLNCSDNQLTSLEEIVNLVNLKYLNCSNNQLTSLGGIENFIKLIKNNKNILKNIGYEFIDSNDFVELQELFNNLIKSEINDVDEYIIKIEKMIIELNGFSKYVLK
jgi:Leucine-rich repeat (LRR) protein